MIIGIDIDDTIADTCEIMLNYAQEYTIDVLKKEPILKDGNCNTHFYIQYLHDWKEGEDIEFLNEFYEKIITETRPKTLSIKYLQKLHDEGNKIVLITARWESDKFDVINTTKKWIKKNNVPCDKLIVNAENKLIACKQENVELFIDDSFLNCQMVSESGIKTFLMDTRANKGLENKNIERVFSWPHIYMKIKQIENKIKEN